LLNFSALSSEDRTMPAPHKVAALVPIASFRRVESALGPAAAPRFCAGVDEALMALSRQEARALVVDPACITDTALNAVVSFAAGRGASIVAYSALASAAISRVLELELRTELTWVLIGAEDEAIMLAWSVDPAHGLTAPARVLRHLASSFKRVEHHLRLGTVSLFRGGVIPRSASEFYARSPKSERSSERSLTDAGLQPGTRLLKVARLARGWEIARDDSARAPWIAERAGYGSTEMLVEDSRAILAMPFRHARREMSTPEFSATISQAARRS
jgi:hypothetical protein